VPIGFLGIWLSGIYLPHIDAVRPPPIDWLGFFLAAMAASGTVFGLSVVSLPALPPAFGIVTALLGILCGILYVQHAQRHPAPILSFAIFRNDAFRAATTSGTIFRISSGAIPFLMPLMLQLSFGLNPFQSGMITFAGAIGALTVKFVARRVFAATGFKVTLIAAGLLGAATTAVNGFFTPETSHALIIAFLVMSGLCRSFFFTGGNALSYSEIDNAQASQATSIASVLQQVSLALGVSFAAFVLEASSVLSGSHLQLADFHLAFFVVAGISLFAVVPLFRLDRHAGAAVSGHRMSVKPEAAE
jgi:hypothetical protein